MLLGVTHGRCKGEVHIVVPEPQRFLGKGQFLCGGRHLGQPLCGQEGRLIDNWSLCCTSIRGLGIYRGRTCRLPRAEQSIGNCAQQRKQHNRDNFSLRLHSSLWPTLYSSTQGDNPSVPSSFAFAICTELFRGELARAVTTGAPASYRGPVKSPGLTLLSAHHNFAP